MRSLMELIQMAPPWNEDGKFEDFITAYFNALHNTFSFDRFGRSGEKQYGLDIYSAEKKTVIQCKLKLIRRGNDKKIRAELINELDKDFKSFLEYNERNNLTYNRFIFASTFHFDTHISTECSNRTNDSITVEYWSWDKLKNNLPKEIFREYYRELLSLLGEDDFDQNLVIPNNIDANQFKINKNNSLINQVYDYFKYLFNEIDVLPISLFKNNYLFKPLDDSYVNYSLFTLLTDNDELLELCESIKIEKDNVSLTNSKFKKDVKNLSEKLKYILERLSRQMIFNIQHRKSQKKINIRYSHEKPCSCARCSFGRLNYEATFKGLQKKPKKIKEILLSAYMHYELGNFVESVKYFEDVASYAKKNKQLIRYAIAKFNLSMLYVFVRSNYWGEKNQPELVEKLKAIDTDKLYIELKTDENKKLLDWILNSKFYTSKQKDINKTVNKIRDHYHTQLKGGWSSNSNIWNLINDYAEIEVFLKENFIIYDKFSEYQELTDDFIEGLIMSHAMDESQKSRLEYFDDWLLQKIVFNGDAKRILKLLNRYGLESLKYKPTSIEGDTFLDIVNNYLTKHQDILSSFEKFCEKSNRFFWEKYNSVFCNLMLLVSVSEIEPVQIEPISKNLLKYLNETNFISHFSIEYICLFINRKGKFFDKEELYGFLDLFITNGKFHENDFIESVIAQIKKKHKNIIVDKKTLDNLLLIAFDKCKICNQKHSPDFIVRIYDAIQLKFKKIIKNRIRDVLTNQFDSNLYYMSAIYGIFNGKDEFFNKFIELAKPKPKSINYDPTFPDVQNRHFSQINMLLNLCFKHEIDLSQSIFDDFRNIDNYYSWLFDLEHFDYSKFNPKWTIEYQTKYYFDQFRKFPIIKEKILDSLKEKPDYMLEKLVIELSTKLNE